MPIIVNPTALDLAAGVEGILEVGGSIFTPGQPQGFYPAEYIVGANLIANIESGSGKIFRSSGNSFDSNGQAQGTRIIPKGTPFSVYGGWVQVGGINRNLDIGVKDNLGRLTSANPYNYPPEPQGRFNVRLQGAQPITAKNCNANEMWMVSSDGTNISVLWKTGGIWYVQSSEQILADVTHFTFFFQLGHDQNTIWYIQTRIDDVTLPFTTSNVDIAIANPAIAESRIVSGSQFGITGLAGGDTVAVLTHPQVAEPTNVPISISTLYIRPTDRSCGGIAIQGETVQFESNGGQGGALEASNGTIISTMQWQAPTDDSASGWVTFTYTVGDVSAQCTLNLVKKLAVNGVDVDGYYPDLVQGDAVQFTSTCPDAVFSSPSHPTLISASGFLSAPVAGQDCCFGEKMVVVQVTGCGQTYTFRVKIQAMYPVPRFCGAYPKKWKQMVPDYLANTLTFTGGTSQVKNRNRFGITKWMVDYENLLNTGQVDCTCPNTQSDEHSSNCAIVLTTAKRLDDFYKQVKYTGYFTIIDYHTGIVYKYSRLTLFENDHNMHRTEQIRRVEMRWEGNINIATGEPACGDTITTPTECPDPPANIILFNWFTTDW